MNGELLARTLKTRQPSAEGRGRGGAAAAGAPRAAARSGTACPPPLVPRSGRGRGCRREPEPRAAPEQARRQRPAFACRRRGPGRLWRAGGRSASRGSGAAERGRRGGRRTQEPEPPPPPPPPASNLQSRRLPPTRPSPATHSPRLTSRVASEQESGG